MVVNGLALIIVFRADTPALRGDGLRRFVRLKAAEQGLFAISMRRVAQPAVAKHSGVMHLHVLGIDIRDTLQIADGLTVLTL